MELKIDYWLLHCYDLQSRLLDKCFNIHHPSEFVTFILFSHLVSLHSPSDHGVKMEIFSNLGSNCSQQANHGNIAMSEKT